MAKIKKKIWPDMFDNDRNLPVDYRLADFELSAGDVICYQEWDPKKREYTGREFCKKVKRVTKHKSPNRYWTLKDLEENGFYIIEFEEE